MLSLNFLAAREHGRELRAAAAGDREDGGETPVTRVTLRYAAAADAAGLRVLAELDDAPAPVGPTLVAEVDGRLRAALTLENGQVISDPFHSGRELLDLLRMRASQLAPSAAAARHLGDVRS